MKSKKSSLPIILGILLVVYSLSIIIPFIWSIFASFKNIIEFSLYPFELPKNYRFENYINAFSKLYIPVPYEGSFRKVYMWEMLFNSVVYSLGCTIMATLTPCLTAYVVVKYNNWLNKYIYGIVIITIILPIVGNLPSEIQLVKFLGIYDSIFGIWIMKLSFANFYFLIFYSTFKSLSWEYAEAAIIDGAGHWKIMTRIMMPLVKPTILAVGLLFFINFWNDYYTPMVYLKSMPTVAYGLFHYSKTAAGASFIPMQLAGCMIVFIPIFILFLLFRNKLIGNLTMGGIKG